MKNEIAIARPALILVTGRPGAGKTTLAHALARRRSDGRACPLLLLLAGAVSSCSQTDEAVRETRMAVEAWSLTVIERKHGPDHSDAILTDLLVQDSRGDRRLLASDLIGRLIPLPQARRILSCEENWAMRGRGPLLIDLEGRQRELFEHPGYLRDCRTVGTGEEILLHYNMGGMDSTYNLVRVLDADGGIILEDRLDSEQEIQFEAAGQVYRVRIPAPQPPG